MTDYLDHDEGLDEATFARRRLESRLGLVDKAMRGLAPR
ncbi:hypothetical protein ACVW0K_007302 [Streptomyces filamentosus]